METKLDIEKIAKVLFPDEYHDGTDCRNFYKAPGEPCPICADKKEYWERRMKQVAEAIANGSIC